jgi:molybdenum-dependent DNA-binding transcriptional regulator ModE
MDLNALKLFVEIVDSGSLSAAARRLHTSRSNVSQRLKIFERAIGVQLLRRSTRHTEPTQVGYALYEHGSKVIRELAGAAAAVATLGKSLHGHLRISVPTILGQLYILGTGRLPQPPDHPGDSLSAWRRDRRGGPAGGEDAGRQARPDRGGGQQGRRRRDDRRGLRGQGCARWLHAVDQFGHHLHGQPGHPAQVAL